MAGKRPYTYLGPVSEQQLKALGIVSVEAAELDSLIVWAISHLGGMPERAAYLAVGKKGFSGKMRVLRKIVREADRPIAGGELLDEIDRAMERRHKLLHATWPDDPAEALRMAELIRVHEKGIEHTILDADETTILDVAAGLRASWLHLIRFVAGAPEPP